MNKLSAVLFDFDGTLQEGDKLELNARLAEISRRMNLGISDDEIYQIGNSTPDYREMRALMVKRALDLNPHREITEDQFQEVNKQVSGMFDDQFYLADGAVETLELLSERGLSIGLVTTRGRVSLPRLLERHGINKYFESRVVCRDNCVERKPNPEPLYLGLRQIGVEPHQAAYVGDSQRDDVGAAKNAGVMAIWKPNGVPFDESGPRPDHTIESLAGLPSIIEKYL